ncbi:hypothetical protein F5Y08DRAFT_322120 [Xylaria arbuscula]|nr:hypothetical protein F5Y08DRAFT_322120 [Xylaria arbuscula]
MSFSRVPVTFTFHRRGVHPPLFVAGSFSKPPWEPQEMNASIDQHGDYIFTKQVMVDECSEIQYKFRHAFGDWWALDPDADTVTDEHGNLNSLLYSPTIKAAQEITLLQEINASKAVNTASGNTKTETTEPIQDTDATDEIPANLNPLRLNPVGEDVSTPMDEIASTAAEVADTASQLDEDDFETDNGDTFPMFSHECFAPSSDQEEPELECDTVEMTPESIDGMDLNVDDPRLEHFPSDRESIFATVRRVSATVDLDPTVVDKITLSPVITARPSFASSSSPMEASFGMDDDENDTADEQPEAITPPLASIASRQSLQSIAEGEETLFDIAGRDEPTPVQYIGPIEKPAPSLVSMGSDEGVSMNITPRKPMIEPDDTKTLHEEAQPKPTTTETIYDKTQLEPITPAPDEPAADGSADQIDQTSSNSSSGGVSSASKPSEQIDQLDVQKDPTNGERPHSPPSSMYSIHDNTTTNNNKGGDWVRTFFRTVLVDWIGDLFCWLCSRNPGQV